MLAQSLLPPWVAFPLAGAVLVFLAGHMIALRQVSMPESRRRIRTANSWMMLAVTPLVAVLFGYASSATPRLFVLTASAVITLIGAMLLLACADLFNNARIAHRERRKLDLEIARVQAEARDAIRRAREDARQDEPQLRLTPDDEHDDDDESEQRP